MIKKRISGRSVCSICGKIYNEFFNPAPQNGDCCASKYLQKRSDDTLEIAINNDEKEDIMNGLIKRSLDDSDQITMNGESNIDENSLMLNFSHEYQFH